MALGGEVFEIETAKAFDASSLEHVPAVRSIKQNGPRRFLVIADDAGTATPRVLQELNAAGVEVESSSEYRPSFDEVFAELVAQSDPPKERRDESYRGRVPRAA